MKVKTVVIINDFNYIQGGASNVAIETAKLLKEDGKNVYFFSAVNKEEYDIEGIKYVSTFQCEALKDKNKIRGFFNGIYNVKAKRKLSELLDELDKETTIVHVHGWTKALSSSIFHIAFKKGFRVVLTLHDYFSACPNGGYYNYKQNKICELNPLSSKCIKCNCDSRNYVFKIYRLIRQFVQNKIIKVNDKLEYAIGISDLNIKILKRTLNKNTIIKKIWNPINVDIKDKANIINNEYYLYVGRITKEKGVKEFCEEARNLSRKSIVVGDGSELKHLTEEYPSIEFTGWKNSSEVYEYMKKARILIFPSLWYEGAPMTPLEAMNYGIPCIVSKYSSATEYIKNNNGEIFDPLKKGDLKDKIQTIETNLEEYSNNAYDYVKQVKNENNYIEELNNFYDMILGG